MRTVRVSVILLLIFIACLSARAKMSPELYWSPDANALWVAVGEECFVVSPVDARITGKISSPRAAPENYRLKNTATQKDLQDLLAGSNSVPPKHLRQIYWVSKKDGILYEDYDAAANKTMWYKVGRREPPVVVAGAEKRLGMRDVAGVYALFQEHHGQRGVYWLYDLSLKDFVVKKVAEWDYEKGLDCWDICLSPDGKFVAKVGADKGDDSEWIYEVQILKLGDPDEKWNTTVVRGRYPDD